MFNIPTLRQAKKLAKKYDHFVMKKEKLDGVAVYQFDYLLASPKDFTVTPYAKELRGICYTTSFFGLLSTAYPMLHKFHNLNECEGYMYDDLKDWEVDMIQVKDDGSVINFIKINDKYLAKSKFSFQSYQAKKAQEMFDSSERLQEFVDFLDMVGFVPIFELVGKDNPIVVEYGELELKLLQIRNMTSGKYVNNDSLEMWANKFGIKTSTRETVYGIHQKFGYVFDRYYKDKVETLEGIEGWVFTLYNPKTDETRLVKIKTKWYMELHGLMTGSTLYANNIIEQVLNGTIDDLVSRMNFVEGDFRKKFIDEVMEKVDMYYNMQYIRLNHILDKTEHLSNKEFAQEYKSDPLFHILMAGKKGQDVGNVLKESIIFKTRRKELAEKFLEGIRL